MRDDRSAAALRRGVHFKAYGAMKAKATLPTMSVQVLVGDDVAITTGNWETIKTGWRVQLE